AAGSHNLHRYEAHRGGGSDDADAFSVLLVPRQCRAVSGGRYHIDAFQAGTRVAVKGTVGDDDGAVALAVENVNGNEHAGAQQILRVAEFDKGLGAHGVAVEEGRNTGNGRIQYFIRPAGRG